MIDELEVAIRMVWESITSSQFLQLVNSMPDRFAEVPEQGGIMTHYAFSRPKWD
jgi:hypothetical protein